VTEPETMQTIKENSESFNALIVSESLKKLEKEELQVLLQDNLAAGMLNLTGKK
jgi:hypothetical protein